MSNAETVMAVLTLFALVVAVASAGSAKSSVIEARKQAKAAEVQAEAARVQADLAETQLQLLRERVAMVSGPLEMMEILPAWYISRMGGDYWGFGLLLKSSDILAISRIDAISTDGRWIEVTLLEAGEGPAEIDGTPVMYAPTDRLSASVQIDAIQAAFELRTS